MKQANWFLFVLILFLLAACSANAQSATPPLSSPPTVELSPVIASATPVESSSPVAGSTAASEPTGTLFTQSGNDYRVNLTPADFVDVVDNPYFPLPLGAKWEYEITLPDGSKQKDTLEVMPETRDVNGVQATVVRDTVSVGDRPVEDTYDWFAQDKYGNVWYVGESVDNYKNGILTSHAGSWEWGVDGALPGIIMWADPSAHLNEEYHQEYYLGRAEDMGQVLSVNENVSVPFGSFDQVVKTFDFSTLETNAKEHKFYAPGIGLLKELDLNTNEELVLIKFTPPAK